jgi:hypothetical protein
MDFVLENRMNNLYCCLVTSFRRACICIGLVVLCLPSLASAQANGFSLHYTPKGAAQGLKYPLKLGVPDAVDGRFMPFHMMSDELLREAPSQGMGDIVYAEMRASGMFSEVRRIRENPPEHDDVAALLAFKQRHGVDLLMLTDVRDLNMRREKDDLLTLSDVTRITPEFKVVIEAAWVSRLVFPDQGVIVWGDLLEGRAVELAKDEMLPTDQLGTLARRAVAEGMADMRVLLARFGKRMAP